MSEMTTRPTKVEKGQPYICEGVLFDYKVCTAVIPRELQSVYSTSSNRATICVQQFYKGSYKPVKHLGQQLSA